jgi:cytochrome P450
VVESVQSQTLGIGVAREIPRPGGLPLFGALPKVRRDPLPTLVEAARRHGDLVCLGGMGSQKVYLASHPDDVEHVFKTNPANYCKGASFQLQKPLAGEGLSLSEGDFWRSQRGLPEPAFHVPRLAALAGAITGGTEAAIEGWGVRARRGEAFDVEREMTRLSLNLAARTLFGSEGKERAEAVRRSASTAFGILDDRAGSLAVPPAWLPTPANLRFQRAVGALDKGVYEVIRDRRRKGEEGDDVLSLLLGVRDAGTGAPLPDRQVRDQVVTLLIAGHESTAISLTWCFYLLSRHPAIERRLHLELDEAVGDRLPGFQDLRRLPYLSMFVKEALRLYPPFWMLTRTPIEDDRIGGHRVPAGSVLLFSPYVTHRHAAFWPNPEAVDPERFTPERSAERPRFAYFPFGGGPRQGIGMRLAEFQIQLVLAAIARRFSLHLVPGRRVEPEAARSLRPRGGLWVTPHERRPIC